MNNKIFYTEEEWKKKLSPKQYYVLRQKGTEKPFSGKYYKTKEKGVYICAGCGNPLFSSETKFDSGTGWPSFYAPILPSAIKTLTDNSFHMSRTEVLCAKCGGHLGHVFDDGPQPTGLRYCINSIALNFNKEAELSKTVKTVKKDEHKTEFATFAAGCFWGVEDAFYKIDGVINTKVGFSGGEKVNPTYEEVCNGDTGHAESVLIEYNPQKVSYKDLLKIFWSIHNPTTLNRQGFDIGSQYRSVIFYHNEEQKNLAMESLTEEQKKYKQKIVTEIVPAKKFYPAEEYHQKYYQKNKINSCGIR